MLAKYTGSGAVAVNFSPSYPAKVENVLIHLSTLATCATTVPLTIAKYTTASVYNTVLLSQIMTSVADVHYTPNAPVQLNPREKLLITWANDASSFKTWGIEIQYQNQG